MAINANKQGTTMSEINEKIISEFLELLKKVNLLEMQVQGMSKDHNDVLSRCTKFAQGMHDNLSDSIKKQNELVQKTNDSLANQVNSALSKVGDVAVESVKSWLERNQNKDAEQLSNMREHLGKINMKVNKTFKILSAITSAFKEAQVIQQQEDQKDERLTILIEDTEFTVRTVNCLRAENIRTLADLIKWTPSELLRTPNLGKKSLREIQAGLQKLGLELRTV